MLTSSRTSIPRIRSTSMYPTPTTMDDVEFEPPVDVYEPCLFSTPGHFSEDVDRNFYHSPQQNSQTFFPLERHLSDVDSYMLEHGQASWGPNCAAARHEFKFPSPVDTASFHHWAIPHERQSSPVDTVSSFSTTDYYPIFQENPLHNEDTMREMHYPWQAIGCSSISSPHVWQCQEGFGELLIAPDQIQAPQVEDIYLADQSDNKSQYCQPSWEQRMTPNVSVKAELSREFSQCRPQDDSPEARLSSPIGGKRQASAEPATLDGDSEYELPSHHFLRKSVHPRSKRTCIGKASTDRKPSTRHVSRMPRVPEIKKRVSRCVKHTGSSDSKSKTRIFECPLAPYGCTSDFPSKNEWKRHINTKHICRGYWRCDLCDQSGGKVNDFNRIDLFTLHLRRIHWSHHTKAQKPNRKGSVKVKRENDSSCTGSARENELDLGNIHTRCWVEVRKAPTKATCAICEERFEGENSTEDWLEHAGRHLLVASRQVSQPGTESASHKVDWIRDETLRDWLLSEGMLELVHGTLSWRLVSKEETYLSSETFGVKEED